MPAARILIVEDEPIVAMDIAATLRRLGYEVAGTAATGVNAIESAEALKPDLVLMDIRLKGAMDGIEAATVIQRQRAVPIVFLTAHADLETVERAKSVAPHGYLLKPFDERALHRTIELALKRMATETKGREEALDTLWQSEERFRLFINALKDHAIFMIDLQGRIASWNAGAERMTGFTTEDVLGESVTILRPPDAKSQPLDELFADIRRLGSAEWDDEGIKKDGSRYLPHVYCTTLLSRSGELLGYATVTRDVTEQRSLEAQLAQAQKLESLGQLAGGIAHDFNNMLMVIFARCEMLLRQLESEKHRKFVSDIHAAAMKNRELTQQLLGAARRQVLDPQVVSLNSVIDSAVSLLTTTLGEQIIIRTELDRSLWNVHADPGKLHQVILNLAINARDAMPHGGVLTVESRNVNVTPDYARQHLGLREGDYVSLVVSDTGTGIPREIRDLIYDPFFTTKEAGRGTGLGLSVVRGIIEQTGGRIWVYSEEGRGTTFKLFLPRDPGEVSDEAAPREDLPQRGRETILLVEDEELLRSVVREALEENGYHVLEASSPAAALQLYASSDEQIDLLLSDMIMPGMTGKQLAEHLTAARPSMRVVIMSGYTSQGLANHAALSTRVRFVEKPISTPLLIRAIRAALDDGESQG